MISMLWLILKEVVKNGLIIDENQTIKEGFGVFTSNNFEKILKEFHKN